MQSASLDFAALTDRTTSMADARTKPFDQFDKQLLAAIHAPAGAVLLEHEVSVGARRVDAVVFPDPNCAEARAQRGLAGRMVSRWCLFELFHDPPRRREIRRTLVKQLLLAEAIEQQQRLARKRRVKATITGSDGTVSTLPSTIQSPVLWLISGGDPEKARKYYRFVPMKDWPPGFFQSKRFHKLRLLVVPMLPVEPDTLILRLFGAGTVLSNAVTELLQQPPSAWERKLAVPLLEILRTKLHNHPHLNHETRTTIMTILKTYEQFERELIDKGIEKGIKNERETVFSTLVVRALGRSLTTSERQQLAKRIAKRGTETLIDAIFSGNPASLSKWIAPIAKKRASKTASKRAAKKR